MIDFVRFTVRLFAFKFALWILHLMDEPKNNSYFWYLIDANPNAEIVTTVDIVSSVYSEESNGDRQTEGD